MAGGPVGAARGHGDQALHPAARGDLRRQQCDYRGIEITKECPNDYSGFDWEAYARRVRPVRILTFATESQIQVCAPAACTPEMAGRYLAPLFVMQDFDPPKVEAWPRFDVEVFVDSERGSPELEDGRDATAQDTTNEPALQPLAQPVPRYAEDPEPLSQVLWKDDWVRVVTMDTRECLCLP